MNQKFNQSFNDRGEKAQFTYKRNPLIAHAFQIFMFKTKKGKYEPVGEYTLIDQRENIDLTEKKLMNIISILNGKQNLLDLGNLTKSRTLYNIVPNSAEEASTKIIFREHDGNGPSEENAVLVLEKGVLNESAIQRRSNA